MLTDAVKRAQASPNFPASLLIKLNTRFCGIYLGMNDGKDAERVARNLIATVAALRGQDSPELYQLDGFLEEALFVQGKAKEAIDQSGRDYAQFRQSLGPENQLTLASLYMHAQAEAAIGDYDDAIRDNLAIYTAEPLDSFRQLQPGEQPQHRSHDGVSRRPYRSRSLSMRVWRSWRAVPQAHGAASLRKTSPLLWKPNA